ALHRGGRDKRQGLPGACRTHRLPGGRSPGRVRPLQRQQGGGGDRDRRIPALLLPSGCVPGVGARGERDRGRGLGGLAEPWNFGPEPGTDLDVEALTERILRAWGGGVWHATGDEGGPREA